MGMDKSKELLGKGLGCLFVCLFVFWRFFYSVRILLLELH